VRVSQDCTNQNAAGFAGRASSQNETSVAVNPLNGRNLLAGTNDYQGADATCGAAFSLDGGAHWGSRLVPAHFTVPGFTAPRHYWDASGDTSVAFDTTGEAYLMCGAFDRGPGVGDTDDSASALVIFRSNDGGASWGFPGSIVTKTKGTGATALLDKQYMTLDTTTSSTSHTNRIYVTWTNYGPGFTASPIYFAFSDDAGISWSSPIGISGSDPALCPINFSGAPPGTCDANQFSDPFVAPNGDVYVTFQNFNNCAGAIGPPCGGPSTDNHNQMLIVKSTDGGATWSSPVKVADFYDTPDCFTYTAQDFGRGCIPTAPLSTQSIFRAENYPTGVAVSSRQVIVDFGSYVNIHSNETLTRGNCRPDGFSPSGLNKYKGVGLVNHCNNDIVRSVSLNGGASFTGTTTDVRALASVNDEGDQLADQWWQWSAGTPSGRVAVSYYDRKYIGDMAAGRLDLTLFNGTGGHIRLTDFSLPPSNEFPDTSGYSVFMGDYNALAVGRDGTAHPVWTDTRNPMFTFCTTAGCNPRILGFAGFGADAYTRAIGVK
jgi:hypothetical protein